MAYRREEDVVRRIVALREERGVSQRQLAEALELDPSAVTRIERGQRGIAVGELATIAEQLDISVDMLLREDEPVAKFRADTSQPGVTEAMETVGEFLDAYRYLGALADPVR